MGNKLNELQTVMVDIEKQMWEIREIMEHEIGINRETDLKELKDTAEEFMINNTDNRGAVVIYYGWLEALSWVKENIENLERSK